MFIGIDAIDGSLENGRDRSTVVDGIAPRTPMSADDGTGIALALVWVRAWETAVIAKVVVWGARGKASGGHSHRRW